MKEIFKLMKFRKDSLKQIMLCNSIIEEYQDQRLRLTLRQLYYQLVSRNIITNEKKSAAHLSALISNARLAGLVDWDAIEDRIRQPRYQSEFENIGSLIEAAIYAYRLPRWSGQKYYVELWVEKDALAGVLEPLAKEFHVTMMVNRGYSSQSAMYESANRFIDRGVSKNKKPILFYLGDHDPSGEDMVRDIENRLKLFEVYDIEVRKLALTMNQIERYNPPPNPVKVKDSRSVAYSRKFGTSSWEIDALRPELLTSIIRSAFEGVIDKDKMAKVIDKEDQDKRRLRSLSEE